MWAFKNVFPPSLAVLTVADLPPPPISEEYETDVAIASFFIDLSYAHEDNTAVLVRGDTVLAPAVRSVKTNFKNKKVIFAFPYKRKNEELAVLSPGSFSIGCNKCAKHQFPNPVVLQDGRKIYKPDSW